MATDSKLNIKEYHGNGKVDKNGNVIIFVHGACSSSAVWEDVVNSRLWGNEYKLVTIDLPGHGHSSKSIVPDRAYTIKGLAVRLASLIEGEWELTSYLLVGNSLATNIIAEALSLLRHCKGVFLTAVSVAGGEIGLAQIVQPNPNLGLVFSPDDPSEEAIRLWTNDIVRTASSVELKEKLAETYKQADPAFRIVMGKAVAGEEWSDEIAILNQQTFPVAIVYGDQEKFLQSDYLAKAVLKLWKKQVIIVPDASHLLPIDQPELLTELVIDYANECFK